MVDAILKIKKAWWTGDNMTIKELIYLLNSDLESDRQIGYAILNNLKAKYEAKKEANNESN